MNNFKKSKPHKKALPKEEILRTKKELEKELEELFGKENYSEFKKFAFKKNMVEMAIAFMLGGAFQKVVTAISGNLMMPVMSYLFQTTGTDWRNYVFAPIQGITLEIGAFVGSFVDFLLISIVLFSLYKYLIQPILEEEKDEEEKIKFIDTMKCPYCYERIYYKSTACKFCTREINLFME